MLLEPKVAPHCRFSRVFCFEIFDLDDQTFTLLLVLIFQGDYFPVIPTFMC